MRAVLKPFPGSLSPVDKIEVEVERDVMGILLTYRIRCDPGRLLLPKPEPCTGRKDDLWHHTCLEAFVQPEGVEGYLEMNFSPSLQWAIYRFDGVRVGMKVAKAEPWQVMWRFPADGLQLTAGVFAGRDLPPTNWRLGLSAVMEDIYGTKTYWALAHPSDKPDFHHPDSFVLDLPAPEPA